MDDTLRPPVPASLAGRPVRGGLAIPWVNTSLRDGGSDFRSTSRSRAEQAWRECRCQSCGQLAGDPAVLVCGPRQILTSRFDEPPACPPCALYASRACPMVAGRETVYPARPRITEGRRGQVCPDPGCGCGGWTDIDAEHSADMGGQPVLPWYAAFIHPGQYVLTAHRGTFRCTDRGCEHERLFINGGQLTSPPLKIILISEPGTGRRWQRLTAGQAAAHARAALATAGQPLPETGG